MSPSFIKWHREHSRNAHFTDAEMTKIRPICKACVYGESRQIGTDQHRIHRLPTRAGQCFYIDAFTCGHRSTCGYKYCDLMRDGISQMIYCNFTKSRSSEEVIKAFTTLWNSNSTWAVYDAANPNPLNPRFIRMDSEAMYTSEDVLEFVAQRGYKIEFAAPRDKHAGGIAERMVGLVTSKTNSAMLDNGAPSAYWNWAMFKATQDLNFNYNAKIKTSPYNFVTGNYLLVLLKDAVSLPTSTLLLSYQYMWFTIVHDNGTYGTIRRSKDVIFDESYIYDPEVDNSPSEEAFAAIIEDVTEYAPDLTHLEPVSFLPTHDPISAAPPVVERFDPSDYQEYAEYDIDPNSEPFPLIVADSDEYELKINEYGIPIYWSKITEDASPTPVHCISRLNYHVFLSMFIMSVSTVRPTTFKKAFALPDWHPPIFKEMDNFIDNNCFHWIKDVGQRRLFMMWLFSIKADMSLKARLVVR